MFRTELEDLKDLKSVHLDPPIDLLISMPIALGTSVTWRRHHDRCQSCGVLFVHMSPMADMIQHWTGACTWEKSEKS